MPTAIDDWTTVDHRTLVRGHAYVPTRNVPIGSDVRARFAPTCRCGWSAAFVEEADEARRLHGLHKQRVVAGLA